ncbi:MAG TPA: glycosyltransferase [Candidatus Hydrogenedentes bacterium]|nr:glycosyltransferase [Candidatus Hydrogenedentota bacterium]
MKPLCEWLDELASVSVPENIVMIAGRGGDATIKMGNVFLHSRYNPREEATRLIDSANLDAKRPVLVLGAGLGYHVAELLDRGIEAAVIEFNPAVARLAAEGVLRGRDVLLAVGDPETVAASPGFSAFSGRVPQCLIHPSTARLYPEKTDAMTQMVVQAALGAKRLRIAVVGPMYGGSLPITQYLERGFRALGHNVLRVDNAQAWPMYREATEGIRSKQNARRIGDMIAHCLCEWTYARVSEFGPDICIVMAQAPVDKTFPVRLARDGVIAGFWYVENWRHLPYWRDIAPYYDVFFHIQPGEFEDQLARAGCPCSAFVQTGCDPDIHRPVELTEAERAEYGCDLSFAGAGYHNRLEMFKGLTDYRLNLWGVGWSSRELAMFVRDPETRFTPERFAKIVAGTKINLNLHSSTVHDGVDPDCDAINPRVFEIAACGGFQLCDPCKGLDALFDFDTELPVYRDLAELREKIDYFLARPEERAAFAQRARRRVLAHHTYRHRAQRMLDVMIEKYGARLLRKGIRVQKTVAEMAENVGRDTDLGRYLASLPADTIFSQDNINELLKKPVQELTYPEKVFSYLREVRDFAETLIALKDK